MNAKEFWTTLSQDLMQIHDRLAAAMEKCEQFGEVCVLESLDNALGEVSTQIAAARVILQLESIEVES